MTTDESWAILLNVKALRELVETALTTEQTQEFTKNLKDISFQWIR
jgi:hypothetical protein